MAGTSKAIGEVLHCSEEGCDFLDVMRYIETFLPEFKHDINDRIIGYSEPGMLQIELVAQNKA
jgi:hypothetical protein